jgi:hypothetical protein
LSHCDSQVESIIRLYESLLGTIPFSALAELLLQYFWGMGTCVNTRAGRVRPELTPAVCGKCHLFKAHRFCGRVGGLSEGLLLWCKETALGIAAVRGAKVLEQARRDCLGGRAAPIQELVSSCATGDELFEVFAQAYTRQLSVQGEDVVAAYALLAPGHVWINRDFLNSHAPWERSETYAFADIAATSWISLQKHLREHGRLFSSLAENRELSAGFQSETETLVTTVDAATLAVIAAVRERDLPLRFPLLAAQSRAA